MTRGAPRRTDLPAALVLTVVAVALYVVVPRTNLYPGPGFWLLLLVMGGCVGGAFGLVIRQLQARRGGGS